MPNWTMNGLICHEDDLKMILDARGNVDFNRVCRMPEELRMESGTITDLAEMYLAAFEANDEAAMGEIEKRLPTSVHIMGKERDISNARDLLDVGRMYRSNRERFGAPTWYEWSIENWGTKWNACNTEVSDLGGAWRAVTFDTAWCPPGEELRMALFDGFEHVFHMEAYDEDYSGIYCTSDICTGTPYLAMGSVFRETQESDGDYTYTTAMFDPAVTSDILDALDAALLRERGAEAIGLDLDAEARDMREASDGLGCGDAPERKNER